jgi:hypothetical protein
VVNNPEIVSRLLANTALLKGERELLRQPEKPPAANEEAKSAVQPNARPIENDSRTVSNVLLTLLDERLQATAPALGQPGLATAPSSDGDAQHRVAAQYAADGLIARDDFPPAGAAVAPDQTRMPNMSPAASADLQTFMQRFAAIALGRPIDVDAAEKRAKRASGHQGSPIWGSGSVLRLASMAAVVGWLLLLIAQWAMH